MTFLGKDAVRKALFSTLLAILLVVPLGGQAQVPATCDNDYWDVLRVRSQMEAKRELEMAQTIIVKPDSVLEYACFGDRIDDLESWAFFEEDLGDALDYVVRDALSEYLGSNFGHSLGGGLGAPSSGCNTMGAVWDFMKCQNFNIGTFTQFVDFTSTDPRQLPSPCPAGSHNADWSTLIAAAYPAPAGAGGMDPLTTFLGQLNPGACASHTPVPTGVVVDITGSNHPDAVCQAPSCWYDHTSNTCKP